MASHKNSSPIPIPQPKVVDLDELRKICRTLETNPLKEGFSEELLKLLFNCSMEEFYRALEFIVPCLLKGLNSTKFKLEDEDPILDSINFLSIIRYQFSDKIFASKTIDQLQPILNNLNFQTLSSLTHILKNTLDSTGNDFSYKVENWLKYKQSHV